MTTPSADVAKPRSAPLSWLLWLGGVVLPACLWCFRKFVREKNPPSRSEEKQRRKALVREFRSRK